MLTVPARIVTAGFGFVLVIAGGVSAPTAFAAPTTTSAHVHYEAGYPMPDRSATPGRWTPDGPSRFCHSGYTERVRNVSVATKRQVFADYGISYARHSRYEVDHLVPLELGGSNAVPNLWPERGHIPNKKDGLENELHDLVCERKLNVGVARRAIARDWVKALHRYGTTGYVYERSGSGSTGGSSGGSSTHSCTTTSTGSCIRGGQYCPKADYGKTGYDANGNKLTCTGDRTHPRWS